MAKTILLLVLFIFVLYPLARPYESPYDIQTRKEFNMHPEWFACNVTADCTLVAVPCMASLAVSVKFKIAAQNAIDQKLGSFHGCDGSMVDYSKAVCDKRQCVTASMSLEEQKKKYAENLGVSPEFKLKIVGFGCIHGFGAWIEPPKGQSEELLCDEENLKLFASFLGRCDVSGSEGRIYDADKDGCVTCQDYVMWKNMIKKLYQLHKRSTDGDNIKFKPCGHS